MQSTLKHTEATPYTQGIIWSLTVYTLNRCTYQSNLVNQGQPFLCVCFYCPGLVQTLQHWQIT